MQNDESDEKLFTDIGKRLALLLVASDMPDEAKESWIALIPEMSMEQLDRFAKILEANIAGAQGPELEALGDALRTAREHQEQEKAKAVEKAEQSLDEIEKMLTIDV